MVWILPFYFSNEVLTKGPGEIIVENYGPIESRLWEVQAPKKSKIMLQFDKEFGFQVEYHRRCFYDKARGFTRTFWWRHFVTNLSPTRDNPEMKYLSYMEIKSQNMLDFVAPKQIRLGHLMHFGSSVHLVRILLKCGMFHLIPIQIKYTLPLTQTNHIILKAGIHSPEPFGRSTSNRKRCMNPWWKDSN